MPNDNRPAIVAGVGGGLGAALCRALAATGRPVAALARTAPSDLQEELGPERLMALACDVTDADQVAAAVDQAEARWGPPGAYVHNAAGFLQAPFAETPPADFEALWRVTCLGAVHGARRVLPAMAQGGGALVLVGATASRKGGAGFAAFASAKFALRGLAQSLAREYGPRGVHVAHLVIDGVIRGERAREAFGLEDDQCLRPEAIAETCLHLIGQDPSAWTHELDIRPDREPF